MHPWEAESHAAEAVNPGEAVGSVCAEAIWAYPPGIPLVVPGEVLSAEVVQAIRALCAPGEIRVISGSWRP
jgi:arginine/lysine/ornithine decarboxylase